MADATVLIFISQIVIEASTVHFTYGNFAWGLHGGVYVNACFLFCSCMDVIVVRVKVSRGIVPFSPIGIDTVDTKSNAQWGDLPGQITFTSK